MDAGKLTENDYVRAAKALAQSMRSAGFWMSQAIPVDAVGQILGGAHRLACALALDKDVWVQANPKRDWRAPDWGRQWFIDNGMSDADMARLDSDWAEMCKRARDEV